MLVFGYALYDAIIVNVLLGCIPVGLAITPTKKKKDSEVLADLSCGSERKSGKLLVKIGYPLPWNLSTTMSLTGQSHHATR